MDSEPTVPEPATAPTDGAAADLDGLEVVSVDVTEVVTVDADVVRCSYEAAILAPLGPLDAHALLDLDDPVDRLERVATLLHDEIEVLQFRLSG